MIRYFLIDRLMIQTVHTGSITAVTVTVEMIFFLIEKNIHYCPYVYLNLVIDLRRPLKTQL